MRAVAGGLLASSAVLALVVGFAAQRSLGNFVAGLLIAISQPIRLGDRVVYDGDDGVVEEIGLTYTFIRTADHSRLVVPNEKLASDTIRNASIRGRETYAEVIVQVPLSADLDAVVAGLREETGTEHEGSVFVSALNGTATVTIRRGRRRRGRRRAARARPAPPRARPAARAGRLGMTAAAFVESPSPGDARLG